MKNNHPLPKQIYPARLMAMIFFVFMAYFHLHQEISPLMIGFLVFIVIWPNIALLISLNSESPVKNEFRSCCVDGFLQGILIANMSFALVPSIVMLSARTASDSFIGGIRLFVRGVLSLGLGILLSLPFHHSVVLASNNLTNFLSMLFIFLYVSFMGLGFHSVNVTLIKIKKNLSEKKQSLEQLSIKLSKYLSPQVYDSIFSGEKDVKIETYQKKLTVFFSDIAGFTAKTENTDIEHLTNWLNNYLDSMATVAIRYEGTLDKFIGDAVMVFFGDPKTQGEKIDAIKCVLMAMEMREQAKLMGVDIRIGINSGNCIVGNFGSDQHMEYTIIGGAVNLAARLESNSQPGKILISDTTYEYVKEVIRCKPRGKIKVKGIEREINTYWVLEYDLENLTKLYET